MTRSFGVAIGVAPVVFISLLGCSGLFAPSAPVELTGTWELSHNGEEWRVGTSSASELTSEDWRALRGELEAQECRHLDVGHFTDSNARKTLGFFDCCGVGIDVDDVPGDLSQLAIRLAEPQPVPLNSEPVWESGQVIEFPDAIVASGFCDDMDELTLLPGGAISGLSGPPFAMRNVGTWDYSGGTLRVNSQWVDEGETTPVPELTRSFECTAARLWTQGSRKGWLCEDRYLACAMGGDGVWVHVVGPPTARDSVGRALATDSRFGSRVPVVPDDATAGAALTVAYRPDHEELAVYVAALLERDLGVRPTMHERPEAGAPIVVGVPADLSVGVP